MSAKIHTGTVTGLQFEPVEVEIDISNGLPVFVVVGLPDTAVQESRERVKSALKNSGFEFPRTRVTASLAPADLRKEGPLFDVPIALGVLAASGLLPTGVLGADALFCGELALDGSIRPIQGMLSFALGAAKHGKRALYIPAANALEAALVPNLIIYPVSSFIELVRCLKKELEIAPAPKTILAPTQTTDPEIDFAFIQGQGQAKRALEVAAAGAHNVLLSGPPGAGKTLLARALPGILPPLTYEETLEATQIWSVAGTLPPGGPLLERRPFRSPHHTSSSVALIGGGSHPKPGEISLAHRGVLFLDEFPEFQRSVIENLRQPLEDGYVTVARAASSVRFPTRFLLVAAQNPCPCGYYGDLTHQCTCSPAQILKYQKKISGPILDRIDLHLQLPKVEVKDLASNAVAESSNAVRARVLAARELQRRRFASTSIITNNEMSSRDVKTYCQLPTDAENLLWNAAERLRLSARAYYRVLKVARTIADLAGSECIETPHLAEALQYRES